MRNDTDEGAAKYPPDHQAGMRVPKGGSMCKNCKYLADARNRLCESEYFIAWEGEGKPAGSDKIPYAIDEYCSDFYEPMKEKPLGKEEAGRMTFKEILDSMRPAEAR